MNACLLTLLLSAGGLNAEISTLDGRYFHGEVTGLDDQVLILRGDEESQQVPRAEILQVIARPASVAVEAAPLTVLLVDGSRLHASGFTCSEGHARVELHGGDTLEISTRLIVSVRFWPPMAQLDADWSRILEQQPVGDLLVLRRASDSLDYLDGVVGDVIPSSVQFTFEGREIAVDRQRLEGIVYAHAAISELAPLVCLLEETGGSRWQASEITLAGQAWNVITRSGVEVQVPVEETRLLDFSSGKLLYLSDLDPANERWSPYIETASFPLLDQQYALRRDESLDGGPLELLVERPDGEAEVVRFARGLALHSRSEVTYRLPGGFRRFQALAGIDQRVHPNGHVRLQILGDDSLLFDEPISGVTEGGEPATAVPLDLDIEGISRLTIIVDFGENQDVGDHLDLCNAQIRK